MMRMLTCSLFVVLMLLGGCRPKQSAEKPAEDPKINVVASGDSADASWCVGDEIVLITQATTSVNTVCSEVDEEGRALFSIDALQSEAEAYSYDAIFPSSAIVGQDSLDIASVPLLLPQLQRPSATYHDVMADIRIARHQNFEEQPTDLSLEFSRVVALGTVKLEGLPEGEFIKDIVLSVSDNKPVVGEFKVNLLTGQLSYDKAKLSSDIKLHYDEPISPATPIYFAALPFELVGGQSITLNVLCGNTDYTLSLTLDEDERMMFQAGCITEFSVSVPEPEEQNFTFRRVDKIKSGKCYLIAAQRSMAEPVYDSFGYLNALDGDTDDAGEIVLSSLDEAFIFEKTDGGYTIKQAYDGKYLFQLEGYNSFNVSTSPTEGNVWRVEPQGDLTFKITNTSVDKFVQYHASHDSFGSYSSMQPSACLPMLYELDGKLAAKRTVAVSASQSYYDLDLPAVRSDGAYPDAVTVNVVVEGERNYTMFYDRKSYTSLWVAYPLSAVYMGSNPRPSGWSYNPYISTSDQVNLCSRSYNDDYSRGHLIPNASRNGNREMQLQTFYVTNSVPQIQDGFNGGIWQQLESALQKIAERETIYIVTGVAFEKLGETREIAYTTAKDDSCKVPVPNYFYKVVLRVKSDESGAISGACSVGFWFEHRSYSDTYENYAVSVDQIEKWTGFDYFADLADGLEALAEQNSSWRTFKSW